MLRCPRPGLPPPSRCVSRRSSPAPHGSAGPARQGRHTRTPQSFSGASRSGMGNAGAGLCQNHPKHEAELRGPALQIPFQHPLPSLLPIPSRLLPPLLLPSTSFPAQDPVEATRNPVLPRKTARPAAHPLRRGGGTDRPLGWHSLLGSRCGGQEEQEEQEEHRVRVWVPTTSHPVTHLPSGGRSLFSLPASQLRGRMSLNTISADQK